MGKVIFYLTLVGLFIYVGILFGLPHYDYRVFKSDIKETLAWSVEKMGDEAFRQEIMKYANESHIPIQPEDIVITQTDKRRDVAVAWQVTVDLFGVYQKTYDFQVDTSEEPQ
jgi:hypothetical protein